MHRLKELEAVLEKVKNNGAFSKPRQRADEERDEAL